MADFRKLLRPFAGGFGGGCGPGTGSCGGIGRGSGPGGTGGSGVGIVAIEMKHIRHSPVPLPLGHGTQLPIARFDCMDRRKEIKLTLERIKVAKKLIAQQMEFISLSRKIGYEPVLRPRHIAEVSHAIVGRTSRANSLDQNRPKTSRQTCSSFSFHLTQGRLIGARQEDPGPMRGPYVGRYSKRHEA